VRFPWRERLEFALVWTLPISLISALTLGFALSWSVALATALGQWVGVPLVFSLMPMLPVVGPRRWGSYGFGALCATGIAALVLLALGSATSLSLGVAACAQLLAMFILSLDLAGTTPLYPSTINSFRNQFSIELLDDKCTGATECVQVCPRDVLHMNGPRRKVEITRPESCIRCGACIVQCPSDALQFRFEDGRVVLPQVVRTTRLNMLGRRSISLPPD
jgi:NAD-dependent dihydropyrimidine dehydrogenase PreA subunit